MDFINEIEHLRIKMATAALEKGFTSSESITLSQELDRLLNLYADVEFESYDNYSRGYKIQ